MKQKKIIRRPIKFSNIGCGDPEVSARDQFVMNICSKIIRVSGSVLGTPMGSKNPCHYHPPGTKIRMKLFIKIKVWLNPKIEIDSVQFIH